MGGRELRKDLRLLVNGRDIAFLNGLDMKLQEGDTLSFIPPLAGKRRIALVRLLFLIWIPI
jgi:molybdopterin converting factor small subunit